ncbi:MAG: HNH endonuclease signature motif containing protein, partial [Mycobacteriales bacterium]
ARDRGCIARGCTRPPAFCDAHHLRALAHGGPTTCDNMVLLCRRHHTAWHQGRITLADLQTPWLTIPVPRPPPRE